MPGLSNYAQKYRAYGQLADYIDSETLYLFDVKMNKFIKVQRSMLSKLYTKFGCCNYCPCARKVQSPSSILQHIQSIENRYFCYLILDDENQNDQRNKEKIQVFVNATKNGTSFDRSQDQLQENKSPTFSNRSLSNIDSSKFYSDETDDAEEEKSLSSEYLSINDDNNERNCNKERPDSDYYNNDQENSILLINQMERSLKKDYKKLSLFFNRLKEKVNISSLDQCIINSQEQLILSKRDEDIEAKEKDLTFTKQLELSRDDLEYLMKKYDVPSSYQIKNIEVNLNLNLKAKNQDQLSINNYEMESQAANDNELNDNELIDNELIDESNEVMMEFKTDGLQNTIKKNSSTINDNSSIKIKQEID